MHRNELHAALSRALIGRRLTTHPFYRRWTEGRVTREELASYATQYRKFEAQLPETLAAIALRSRSQGLEPLAVQAERNLADERGTPTHLELFERFAQEVGAAEAAASEPTSPAMERLLSTYTEGSPVGRFAALWAYEAQAAEVASLKGDGLRKHHGLPQEACEFWDLHAELDDDHADWALAAMAQVADDATEAARGAEAAAVAWWEFLDEREALAQIA